MDPEIRLVFASAGSGKTYALARRYLELLMGGGDARPACPGEILAITFTNKAAWEMKERILLFLKTLALDQPAGAPGPGPDRLRPPGVSPGFACRRAAELLDRIFSDYRVFQVQTIDSFVNTVLKSCAFRLGLRPDFEVCDDSSGHLAWGFDLVLDEAARGGEPRAELERLLQQHLRLAEAPSWNPARDIRAVCGELFRLRNTYPGAFVPAAGGPAEIYRLREEFVRSAGQLLEQAPAETNGTFRNSLAGFVARRGIGFPLDRVSSFFRKDGFPVRGGAPVPGEVRELWARMRACLGRIAELEPSALFNDHLAVFGRVEEGLREKADRENLIFLSELNRRMHDVMGGSGIGVPEILCRLAGRCRHYLLDEFQDTSRLQWANLWPLVNDALASGGTLFCVGDRKQAIYRFRGGDDRLMAELRAGRHFRSCRPEVETLAANYRSAGAIIDFNNRLFSMENLDRFIGRAFPDALDDPDAVLDAFSGGAQEGRPGGSAGLVRLAAGAAEPDETPGAGARRWLEETVSAARGRGWPPESLAVLCRTNRQVAAATGWLLEAGLPVQSEKTLNLKENRHVQELISFLRFLNMPLDNLSFAAFAGGDIFCRAAGLERAALHRFIFRCREERRGHLYTAFRDEFGLPWGELVEEFFSRVGFYPPYEMVVSILRRFRVLENFPGDQGFFMRLLEMIREQEPEPGGLADFLDFFDGAPAEKLYVRAPHRGAVRVMSVHAAKGLQFPVVLLPFFEMSVAVNRGGGDARARQFSVLDDGGKLQLLRFSSGARLFSATHDELYRREMRFALSDELNAAYVALTRAEQELHLFVPEKTGRGPNPVLELVSCPPGSVVEKGVPARVEPAAAAPGTTLLSPPAYPDWLVLLDKEFVRGSDFFNRRRVVRGLARHAALAAVTGGADGAALREQVEKALETQARVYPFYERDFFSAIAGEVLALVRDGRFRPFFFPAPETRVFTEKEVVGRDGATRVIDRLVVSPGRVTVLEFKGSREGAAREQRRQLAEYRALVEGVYPGREVTGLLVYLDEPGFPVECG